MKFAVGDIVQLGSGVRYFSRQSHWARENGLSYYTGRCPWADEEIRVDWCDKPARFRVMAVGYGVRLEHMGRRRLDIIGLQNITDPTMQLVVKVECAILVNKHIYNTICPYCRAPAYMTATTLFCSKQCQKSIAEQKFR